MFVFFHATIVFTFIFVMMVQAENNTVPWSGRIQDYTVEELESTSDGFGYSYHILQQRNGSMDVDPDLYLETYEDFRTPAFNNDTGAIQILVDASAQFNQQNNFRRSEIVTTLESTGAIVFRASLYKEVSFTNLYEWQVYFGEDHAFEVRINATKETPTIMFVENQEFTSVPWEVEFELQTWYNFEITYSSGLSSVYISTGDDEPAFVSQYEPNSDLNYIELHAGMLTLTDDGSTLLMDGNDTIYFSGLSVDLYENDTISTGASC